MSQAPRELFRSTLFRRIFTTFVATLVAGVGLAATIVYIYTSNMRPDWIAQTAEVMDRARDGLVADLGETPQLEARVRELSESLDGAPIAVYDHRGRKRVGPGRDRVPRRVLRRLERTPDGEPLITGRESGPPRFHLALRRPESDEIVGVAYVVAPPRGPRRTLALTFLGAVILMISVGAYLLAQSLASRLAELGRSADRIAGGELGHRATLRERGGDEIDEVADAFNRMADRVQSLLEGQRVLLANVSHELRTPVARMRVLLELVEDRAAGLSTEGQAPVPAVGRLQESIHSMQQDITEIDTLIGDLLTSGRLELRDDVEREQVDMLGLAQKVAGRFDARVVPQSDATQAVVSGDGLLLDRLLSNLLANARRACPDGALEIHVGTNGGQALVQVIDEGPGIPPEARERVFEPFARMDAARARDAGGVGLGLYLCRQIAQAHGGTIGAVDREDGRSGARLVVNLPLAP